MKHLEIYLFPIDAQRFQAVASQSPAGDGSAESSLPFWQGALDRRKTLIKLLELSSGFRAEAFPDADEQDWMIQESLLAPDRQSFHPAYLETVGQRLYQALFPVGSSLRSTFETSLRLAEPEPANEDLHLRLKFAANSAERSRLADYPWELLHDGQRFLLHHRVVLSRYLAYEALPPALPSQAQLRVLLISSTASDPAQGLIKLPETEQQAIRQGLSKAETSGVIALESLSPVTRRGLSIYLTDCDPSLRPQVIHFDGHGLYGKRCINPDCRQMHNSTKVERCRRCQHLLPDSEGFLLFKGESGGSDYVSAREFAALLPSGVALVVLSACQSGMAVAGESLFNGTAQQLIDARIPAVVAMQYMVRVDAASQFSEQFYRVLGKKEPLVVALREGRKWMMELVNQWYRPVLYLRWRDNGGGQLFQEMLEPELSDSSKFYDSQIAPPTPLLPRSEWLRLYQDLMNAFEDTDDFQKMLELYVGENFEALSSRYKPYDNRVLDTVKRLNGEGKSVALVSGAVQAKPQSPHLQYWRDWLNRLEDGTA
ncbi:CHAT domain-containing protein [Sphaerothrix gracilis]|uniref:CHAT domain-containing protein n=1 Tax=Sphaerothrix gracilis TaxID=3151835 RepID=UPI0031FCD7D7